MNAQPLVGRASKVMGVGMNYRSFLSQLGLDPPEHPILFHKTAASLNRSGAPIVVPPETREVVPEGELAVVLGRRAHRIGRDAVVEHLAGLACANDVSARNLEFQTSQWTAGKMLPGFCPLGTVHGLEGQDILAEREIRTFVDGTEVQSGRTGEMVFDIPDLVSRISHLVTLERGDVILTGTPSDLGAAQPPVFLRHGQSVRVEVDGLDPVENEVVHAPGG